MFKGILKNTTYLMVSEVIGRVISLVQVPIIVRYLGKNDYGILSLAAALPSVMLVITDIGLHSHIIREISRTRINFSHLFKTFFLSRSFYPEYLCLWYGLLLPALHILKMLSF